MSRRSIESVKARAEEFADVFDSVNPKPGAQTALFANVFAALAAGNAPTAAKPLTVLAIVVVAVDISLRATNQVVALGSLTA